MTDTRSSAVDHPNGFSEYEAIITAGGMGTRMLPFSKVIPKEMFPIITYNGRQCLELKPLVQAIYEQLYGAGIRSFYVVVGRGKRAIEDHFTPDPVYSALLKSRGKDPGCLLDFYDKVKSSHLVFLNQAEPLGFGDAVLLARPHAKGSFIVQAGDTIIHSERDQYLRRLVSMHRKYRASATVLLEEVPNPRQFGVVEGNYLEDGVIVMNGAEEKPEAPRTNLAIVPVYVFTEEIFDALIVTPPGKGGELQLTDGIQKLIEAERTVIGVKLKPDELRLDLGSPEQMVEALKLSLMQVDSKMRYKIPA